jgi:hypothetical protein
MLSNLPFIESSTLFCFETYFLLRFDERLSSFCLNSSTLKMRAFWDMATCSLVSGD